MRRFAPLAVLILLLAATAVIAQPLPMPSAPPAPAPDPSWWGGLFAYVQHVQGDLYRGLAKAVHGVKDQGSLSALSWLLGLSFFYGVVHAAGPGHGKAVITAYLVAEESAVRRGIILSFLSAATQGVTAILAVGILAAIFGFISKQVVEAATTLEKLSGVMIAGVGIFLVVQTVRSILAGEDLHAHAHVHAHDHSHGHVHADGHAHDHSRDHEHDHTVITPQEASSWRKGLAVVASVGVRPCGGAILVLLFTLAQGVFLSGILATAAMSLGTAITVAVLAVLASGARNTALRLAGTMDGWMLWTYWGLSIAGGLFLLLFGVVLFFAPLPPLPGAG